MLHSEEVHPQIQISIPRTLLIQPSLCLSNVSLSLNNFNENWRAHRKTSTAEGSPLDASKALWLGLRPQKRFPKSLFRAVLDCNTNWQFMATHPGKWSTSRTVASPFFPVPYWNPCPTSEFAKCENQRPWKTIPDTDGRRSAERSGHLVRGLYETRLLRLLVSIWEASDRKIEVGVLVLNGVWNCFDLKVLRWEKRD